MKKRARIAKENTYLYIFMLNTILYSKLYLQSINKMSVFFILVPYRHQIYNIVKTDNYFVYIYIPIKGKKRHPTFVRRQY